LVFGFLCKGLEMLYGALGREATETSDKAAKAATAHRKPHYRTNRAQRGSVQWLTN